MADAQQPVTTLPTIDNLFYLIELYRIEPSADHYKALRAALAPVFARAEKAEKYREALQRIDEEDDSPCEDGECDLAEMTFCHKHSPYCIARAALEAGANAQQPTTKEQGRR